MTNGRRELQIKYNFNVAYMTYNFILPFLEVELFVTVIPWTIMTNPHYPLSSC